MTDPRLPPDCIILGGGGHARVLIEALGLTKPKLSLAVLDRDEAMWGKDIMGVPILGGDELLDELVARGLSQFLVASGSVGDTTARRKLFALGLSKGLEPVGVVHPTALVSRSATLGAGAQVLAGAKISTNARLGLDVLVNTGAIVDHDCELGDHVHVATGAILSGMVTVGAGTHIGAGAVIRQCLTLGRDSIVGVGAVVVKDVGDGSVVAGVPARPLTTGT